jgi:signal transduction histidine kinase
VWIFCVLALLCAQAVASLTLHRGFALVVLSDLTQLVLLVSAVAALALNAVKARGRARLFWTLMALGVGLWLTYQCLWSYIEVYLHRDVPDPFGGDVVLFLHLVPMMAALTAQPHREQSDQRPRTGSLDFALLGIWWIYLYLLTVIPWQYVLKQVALYDYSSNTLYLTEKIVFLAGLVLLWIRARGPWRTVYANWFGASLVYAFSSYLANWAIARHVYFSGSIYDVPLAASMAWVTVTALISADAPVQRLAQERSAIQSIWIARLGMLCILSLPLFAAWDLFDKSMPHPVRVFRLIVTMASMLVMCILVFFKQILLDKELLRLLATSRDSLENLKRVQNQLVQSEKLAALGQLVGGAAHELNNPLAAMMGYTDMLSATPLSVDQRALSQKIEHQVRRTRTLVASLLSFAKQVPTEKTLLDINPLVQTAVKLCPPHLRGAHIKVTTELTPDLPKVLADSNQLLQVCVHISNNALHAMAEKGGTLTVTTQLEDETVVVEFSDEGPGIKEPERVFDPFYTTRPVGQGMGLGLSACYGIIQDHKGRIMCQNRPRGGATFRIELPSANGAALEDRLQKAPASIW